MEKEEKNILYATLAEGEQGRKKDLLQGGLSIKKSGRKFPYLYWDRRTVTAGLWVYSAFLPQFEKRLFGERKWEPETAEKILGKTAERAASQWRCYEQILSPALTGNREGLPVEVMAVCLYRYRPFDKICLSLPEEQDYNTEQVMWLLRPYLSRNRKAVIWGPESENEYRIREELYQEFGLVLSGGGKPEPEMVWLDLREEEERKAEKETGNLRVKYVNRSQAWNFLDTTVKNGYNTEVN